MIHSQGTRAHPRRSRSFQNKTERIHLEKLWDTLRIECRTPCGVILQRCNVKKSLRAISLSLHEKHSASTASKSHTSQSIRVCSSHFLPSLLSLCCEDSGDIFKVPDPCLETFVHVPTPPRPPENTHRSTQRESRYTHTHAQAHAHTQTHTHALTPRLEPGPSVLVYLREAGAWHGEEAPVDSVLRLPMLLFWSAASWWQIYIKLIVFSLSLRFSSLPAWHWGEMLL